MRKKYPRTPHLPWSSGATSDDVRIVDLAGFEGRRVVVTEKLDGENTSLYRDGMHARSIDSRHHPSRDWVKGLQARIGYEIPDGWRLCGENMYARHSVAYDDLESFFYLFSVWNGRDECLAQWARSCKKGHLGLKRPNPSAVQLSSTLVPRSRREPSGPTYRYSVAFETSSSRQSSPTFVSRCPIAA